MRVLCPNCETKLRISNADEDMTIDCPKCREPFRVPAGSGEDDEDEAPRPKYRKPKGKGQKKFPVVPAIAGGVALLIVVALVIGLATLNKGDKGDKKTPAAGGGDTATPANPQVPNGPTPQPNPGHPTTNPGPGGLVVANQPPPEIAELFRADVTLRAPTSLVASLRPTGNADQNLLSVVGPRQAPAKAAPDAGKLTLEDLKKASVYIKVIAPGRASSGSGFVIKADKGVGLIATNHHVIEAALTKAEGAGGLAKVSVVFDSGLPTEQEYPATVIAFDPHTGSNDLAVLRVTGVENLPKPIDPRTAVEPTETLPVLICGFPLGEILATGGRSPAITINSRAAVSSLRRDKSGRVQYVQLDATINPGNSGGPVVDADGHLVGISVAIIRGSAGISLAVPAAELNNMLDGRILYPAFLPVSAKEGEATLSAVVPVADPLNQIKSVSMHLWTSDGKPPAPTKDPDTGFKLVPDAQKFDLPKAVKGLSTTELTLPADKSGKTVAVQTSLTMNSGAVVVSPPVPYQFKVTEVRTASDAIPLSKLGSNSAKYKGQVLAVKATTNLGHSGRWNIHELDITTETEGSLPGLQFLCEEDIVSELPDAPVPGRGPVRLTVRVGEKEVGGRLPVRVSQIDLIDRRNDRVVRSIPSLEVDQDTLAALNRTPDKYAGQTVTFEADMAPTIVEGPQQSQIFFALPDGRNTASLYFALSKDLAAQFKELNLKAPNLYPARVTARVENRKQGSMRVVTVEKIELLSSDGRVTKTIE